MRAYTQVRTAVALSLIALVGVLGFARESSGFVVDEVDFFAPNPPIIEPSVLPEFAPAGYAIVRQYDSEIIVDGLAGFGWTWDITGLIGFATGIASFVDSHSTTTTVPVIATGGTYEFVYASGIINQLSYYDSSAALVGTFTFNILGGDLIGLTEIFGYTTTYTHSLGGDLVSVTDFLGNTTLYEYGAGHLLTSRTDPWGVVTYYPAPEPATLALFAAGLAGLGFMRRRRLTV